MKLNKENYENIMFDLLEGNIADPQKSLYMEQINNDEFFKSEWELMQYTVLSPEPQIVFQNKSKLLKPENNTRLFNLYIISSIAASLLIFAIFFIKYYKPDPKGISLNKNNDIQVQPKETFTDSFEIIKNEKVANTEKTEPSLQNKITITKIFKTPEIIDIDTVLINDAPIKYEEIIVKGMSLDKIGYNNIIVENIEKSTELSIEKYSIKRRSKFDNMIANSYKIKNIWDDLPNLKLNIKPKVKNYRPAFDITLKGDIIYAKALIEIK